MRSFHKTILISIFLLFAVYIYANNSDISANIEGISHTENYSSMVRVHDSANLFNPTLIDKFERKLNDAHLKHNINMQILTLPSNELGEVDLQKPLYLSNMNDMLILLIARRDTFPGEVQILSMPLAMEAITRDTAEYITKGLENLLANDRYEASTIRAVDQILDILDDQVIESRSVLSILLIIFGILGLAYILYKFATSNFKEDKKKLRRIGKNNKKR